MLHAARIGIGIVLSGVAIWNTAADRSVAREPARHALLVGCSKYDHLDKSFQLAGPLNDVRLMRELLTGRFQFASENIITLSEDADGPSQRPLRENILRELLRLTDSVDAGDRVVIYLSGHGSRQPDDDPDHPDDLEPDGLDEVFCPADIRSTQITDGDTIPGAITDDELRDFTQQLRKRGASLWIIIDSCHSGTAIRGSQTVRRIRPEVLLPGVALKPRVPERLGAAGNLKQ